MTSTTIPMTIAILRMEASQDLSRGSRPQANSGGQYLISVR
jgi:hypothetical protein